MRLSFLILCALGRVLAHDDVTLTRHADGDVFTIPGSCKEACMVLSSDTASPFGSAPSSLHGNANDSCTCQCNYGLPVFREDLRICVEYIKECDVAGFVSSSGLVEKVPYVFLPQRGQIIYPHAEIKFVGVESPVCVVTGVQQLGHIGWTELRNPSDVEYPLSLYRDEERTFLKWTGEETLRKAAEGKIVVAKLGCRDSYPSHRSIFTTCVAFRVAGSPTRSNIKEVSFATSSPSSQGLSNAEYTLIGISSLLLALVYVASVSLYLHLRKARRRRSPDERCNTAEASGNCQQQQQQQLGLSDSEAVVSGFVKSNPLLSVSRHFESDTNSAASDQDLADKLLQSESEPEIENVRHLTSAIVHPHEDLSERQEQNCNSGSIIGERLPEEDVRVIETTDNGNQHNVPVFPGTQRRKLYFNPAYFERQLLLAPPPAAVEFLLKIREVISIAKHKMAAKRFVPTLNEIPEESSSERQVALLPKTGRKRASSVQNGALSQLTSGRKSLRCSGCPGCSHGSSTPNLPGPRDNLAISGESRVRAWLEDVKLLDTRWRNLEEERAMKRQQRPPPPPPPVRDINTTSSRMSSKSLPPLFGEIMSRSFFDGGRINEVFESDEPQCNNSLRIRSARSVTREPGYFERQADEVAEWARRNARDHEESCANASVRRAIEDSFKKQLEQLRSMASEKPRTRREENVLRNGEAVGVARMASENTQLVKKPIADKSNDQINQEIEETRVLLGIINNGLSTRSSGDAKRIMDAVIQELVVAKEKDKDKDKDVTKASDYETDSLEKSKVSRKSSSSPVSTDKSSPALSTALPMDEELTMRNAIIDVQISETTTTMTNTIVKSHNLPEVVPLRPEDYALVSEVYVNDGYASPTGSDDDSGPEIQYEPENPGHLTIKLVDSPKNYVKQDESEYEPDTLDRKPMKLKINGDITYEKDIVSEVYVDSLERSSQILLKSKRSFREENGTDAPVKPPREYSSLREIYEARLKYQQQQQQQQQKPLKQQAPQPPQMKPVTDSETDTWRGNKGCKCASPLLPRHERRQRKADNQPDVVPKPPPPPPPEIEATEQFAKNAQDRSLAVAGDPTTCEDAPVGKEAAPVVGKPSAIASKPSSIAGGQFEEMSSICDKTNNVDELLENLELVRSEALDAAELVNVEDERRNERRQQYRRFSKWRSNVAPDDPASPDRRRHSKTSRSRSRSKSRQRTNGPANTTSLEDSAYVSSPDSANSRRCLLLRDISETRHQQQQQTSCSCTESDESTSHGGGANSESGGESIETDSVFFGNFRPREAIAGNCQRQGAERQSPINYQPFQMKSKVY